MGTACSLNASGLSVLQGSTGGAGASPVTNTGGASGSAIGGASGAGGTTTIATGAAGTGGAPNTAGTGGAANTVSGAGGATAVDGGAGQGGTIGSGGTAGAANAGTSGTGATSTAGCADGTREAFLPIDSFPSIAGCAGGWTTAGLLTAASMTPSCARAGGNDGSNPNGTGCTVEDLCAEGWHVCEGVNELNLLGKTCQDAAIPPAANGEPPLFFATRQRGEAATLCTPGDTTGVNNVHGCGNFGLAENVNCTPALDRQLSHTECAATPPWSCNDPASMTDEALVVTKPGPAAGGVLCCR